MPLPGTIEEDGEAPRALPCGVSLAHKANRRANVLLLYKKG